MVIVVIKQKSVQVFGSLIVCVSTLKGLELKDLQKEGSILQ